MRRYKSLAIDLENRLRAGRKSKQQNFTKPQINENVDELAVRDLVAIKKGGNDVVDDSKKPTGNNGMTLAESDIVSGEKISIEFAKFEANDSPRSLHLDINSITTGTVASDMMSPSFSLHSSPSMGALNDVKNQTLYLTPYSVRDSPDAEFSARKLIRSNSYTIDQPSPLLLQLMEANGINAIDSSLPKATASSQPSLRVKDKVAPVKQAWAASGSKIAVKKSPTTTDGRANKVTSARKSTPSPSMACEQPKKDLAKSKTNSIPRRNFSARSSDSVLRTVHDSGLGSRPASNGKLTARSKLPAPPTTNGKLSARVEKPTVASEPETNVAEIQRILKIIEEQHSEQLNKLIARQQEEQRRMQEEFVRQQEMLVEQISHMVWPTLGGADVSVSSNLNKSTAMDEDVADLDTIESDRTVSRDHNGNQLNCSRSSRKHPTPESLKCMRRLVYYDDNEMVSTDLIVSNDRQSDTQPAEMPPLSSGDLELLQIQNDAATIITAYAKGYLTRRLFRTVKVQHIVKTIKDTLLFILDIHFENPIENDTPADLKLKTHLIQQVRTQF